MTERKSHARVLQTIIQLRQQKGKLQESFDIDTACSKQLLKPTISATSSLENSQLLSQSEAPSLVLPKNHFLGPQDKNFYKISNFISSQSYHPSKIQNQPPKRQIKSARPVSRRKITSKEKYSKTVNQKEEIFKIQAKKSQVFQQLQILEPYFFIIQKQDCKNHSKEGEIKSLKAFWAKSHTFVSLFPLEFTECVIYNHPNILPVYGEVTLKNKRFVVSNEYKHCSLRDMIKEFGAFQEKLCKIYLYEILSGLHQMHDRKMAHNRLSTESVLCDKEGKIFINVVKSTSKALNSQEKEKIFEYSPEILFAMTKSSSRRSDIWSIGILLLDMLFNFEALDPSYMSFHPYNTSEQKMTKDDAMIVDNLRQMYPNLVKSDQKPGMEKEIVRKFEQLSFECKDLIFKCLKINRDERITLKALKQHAFFFK